MPTRWFAAGAALVALTAAMALQGQSGDASTEFTERASVSTAGQQGNGLSGYPALSGDGAYVAFASDATNLVSGDTNGARDVFVRDRQSGLTERASVDSSEAEAAGTSYAPSLSGDGRYVAFSSSAPNLVAGDTNGVTDIFLRDRATGSTAIVSVGDANVQANDPSYEPSISSDGRFVAFRSAASNLVPDDFNGSADVFVRDLIAGTTARVSVSDGGSEGNGSSYAPRISADGRFVVFWSWASNLVAGDTNAVSDVFVRDTLGGTTTRVSLTDGGNQVNGASLDAVISGDGRFVAFRSHGSNLVPGDTNGTGDVFVRDLSAGATQLISADSAGVEGNGISGYPDVNYDGSLVVFRSAASNLVASDTNDAVDVFVRDVLAGITSRVSVDTDGVQGNYASDHPSISGDGAMIAFHSWAQNLVVGDTNRATDTFVHAFGGTAIATPTPTPTPIWVVSVRGDVNCSGGIVPVDAVDSLLILRDVAALSVTQNEPCDDIGTGGPPLQGDIDCDGDTDAVDALRVLRFVAGMDPMLPPGCPPIGVTVTQVTPAPAP